MVNSQKQLWFRSARVDLLSAIFQLEAPINDDIRKRTPRSAYLFSALAGAFVAFLLPVTNTLPIPHGGVLARIIGFELNYLNALTTLVGVWLAYWLFKRKISGREAIVMYGGLAFVSVRLLLTLFASLRR